MMKIFLCLSILVLLLIASPAWAQSPPTAIVVSLANARLIWQHDLLNVDSYLIDCGSVTHTVLPPTLEAKLSDFIVASGQYTCVVQAVNRYGESGPSNTVSFDAGDPPSDPTDAALISP